MTSVGIKIERVKVSKSEVPGNKTWCSRCGNKNARINSLRDKWKANMCDKFQHFGSYSWRTAVVFICYSLLAPFADLHEVTAGNSQALKQSFAACTVKGLRVWRLSWAFYYWISGVFRSGVANSIFNRRWASTPSHWNILIGQHGMFGWLLLFCEKCTVHLLLPAVQELGAVSKLYVSASSKLRDERNPCELLHYQASGCISQCVHWHKLCKDHFVPLFILSESLLCMGAARIM